MTIQSSFVKFQLHGDYALFVDFPTLFNENVSRAKHLNKLLIIKKKKIWAKKEF